MPLHRLLRFLLLAAPLALAWLACLPAARGADMDKTLHALIVSSETSLDPALASDVNTLAINENIFDPLLRYAYLARPLRLQPNAAAAMPDISDGGRTYVFRIRPGIHFTPSSAFKGRPRELTAQDYAYSFKRLYDPALKSPWLFLFDGRIVGDAVLKRPGRFNPDVAVAGLTVLDRHTLRIRLTAPDPNFLHKLAMPATAAVAREVIEAWPGDSGNHPVGTGPFMVAEWQRSNRIVLHANPDFRTTVFDGAPGADADSQAIAAALKGKRLPLVGRVDIRVMEEQQPRLLGFLEGSVDYLEQVPPALLGSVLEHGKLKPALAAQGIRLALTTPLQTYYLWMNLDDPVLGGYTHEKIALRRAIALCYDRDEDIRVLGHGMALPAQSPLPPDAAGYDPDYRNPNRYDPALARALLDRFGYRTDARDGYRRLPDGTPLTLTMHTLASAAGRERDELWRRNLQAIGIRVVFKSGKYGEIAKAARRGQVQMFETNWVADFPDGDNFFQLLYGPNRGRANYARFDLPAFNQRYEQARLLPDSPARTRLYHDMTQLMHAYAPWVTLTHPLSVDLYQPWLRNYRRHPVEFTAWRYVDIDRAAQRTAGGPPGNRDKR